jgi:prepilin-type processing-associated H-X9-DG protein
LSIARERAKTTSCAGNQGQVAKILLDAMSRTKDKLTSGASGDDLWTNALYKRNILNDLAFVRCTAFEYTNNDVANATARSQAYGVVVADSGKLNFASKKSRTASGNLEISPNKLLLGGCAADKWGDDAKAVAALSFSDSSKLTAIHRGEVNVFFLDGSVMSMDKEVLAANSVYYPKADNSEAVKLAEANILSE